MFIQELSIDGFKSYAQRVTVPHFDRFFNAITGLNGSGKSNILDSICFVLGITDLKQVCCCCVGQDSGAGLVRIVCQAHVHAVGQSQQLAGACLQTGSSRRHQSHCFHCLQ